MFRNARFKTGSRHARQGVDIGDSAIKISRQTTFPLRPRFIDSPLTREGAGSGWGRRYTKRRHRISEIM